MSVIRFTRLKTNADEIKVSVDNGFLNLTFKKEDFPKLLEEGIDFDKYDCKNFKNIEITATDKVTPTYKKELNRAFIEESKSYVDAIHFNSPIYLDQVFKDNNTDNAIHLKITKSDWEDKRNLFLYNHKSNTSGNLAKAIYGGLYSFKNPNGMSIVMGDEYNSEEYGYFDLSLVEIPDDIFDLKNFSADLLSNNIRKNINRLPQINWNKVTDLNHAFKDFESLSYLDGFTIEGCKDATGAFENCKNLKNIDVLNLTICNTTDMFKNAKVEYIGSIYKTKHNDLKHSSIFNECELGKIGFISGSCREALENCSVEGLSFYTEDVLGFKLDDTINSDNFKMSSLIRTEENLTSEISSSKHDCKIELNFSGSIESLDERFNVISIESTEAKIFDASDKDHIKDVELNRNEDTGDFNLIINYVFANEKFESIVECLLETKYIAELDGVQIACTSHTIYRIINIFNSNTYKVEMIEE